MHVRKRVGGPRDRTKNGFLLVSTLLRAVRLLGRDFQRERAAVYTAPFEYSRCSALHACHVKITYRCPPCASASRVNKLAASRMQIDPADFINRFDRPFLTTSLKQISFRSSNSLLLSIPRQLEKMVRSWNGGSSGNNRGIIVVARVPDPF